MRHYQVAEVYWADASIDTKDFNRKQAKEKKAIRRWTTGYLVEETDDCIVLATDFYDQKKEEFAAMMVIPQGMVLEFWVHAPLFTEKTKRR